MLIQLPDDTKNMGYKQTRPYQFEQVFYSAKCNFTGTEREFIAAGFAYGYENIDKHSRLVSTAKLKF